MMSLDWGKQTWKLGDQLREHCSNPGGICWGPGPRWGLGMCEKCSNSGYISMLREAEVFQPRRLQWGLQEELILEGRWGVGGCVCSVKMFGVQGRQLGWNIHLKKTWNQHKLQVPPWNTPCWVIARNALDTNFPSFRSKRKQEPTLLSYVTESELGL